MERKEENTTDYGIITQEEKINKMKNTERQK